MKFIALFFGTALSFSALAADMTGYYGDYLLDKDQDVLCPKDIVIKDYSYDNKYRLYIGPDFADGTKSRGILFEGINKGKYYFDSGIEDDVYTIYSLTNFENGILSASYRKCDGVIFVRNCREWKQDNLVDFRTSGKVTVTYYARFWTSAEFPKNKSCTYSEN
ncbi:MAG: hypothetical protein AB7I27_00075 [Bacteriovoracaceae bacterium]